MPSYERPIYRREPLITGPRVRRGCLLPTAAGVAGHHGQVVFAGRVDGQADEPDGIAGKSGPRRRGRAEQGNLHTADIAFSMATSRGVGDQITHRARVGSRSVTEAGPRAVREIRRYATLLVIVRKAGEDVPKD